jgi:hypothetical protein
MKKRLKLLTIALVKADLMIVAFVDTQSSNHQISIWENSSLLLHSS